jgi:hypothetical protein
MFNHHRGCAFLFLLTAMLLVAAILGSDVYAQTSSTGGLTGVTYDPSGALLRGAAVTLVNLDTGKKGSTTSDEAGRFGFLLLAPGRYQLCASKAEFAQACSPGININVTETRRVELRLQLAAVVNQVQVSTGLVQTDTSALGRVVNETAVSGPIRAAELVALIQTPHRFRTKRQLWNYSGLGLETHDSA